MLRVEGLTFGYGGGRVLDGLDLEVEGGELVGVVGPNGAGKTTLFRLVSGVRSPSAGRIRVQGRDISSLGASEAARLVSVVPQNPSLPAGFTVMELALMGRNPYLKLLQWERRGDLDAVGRAMQATDMLMLADRPIGALSGGERQRALIAMALAQEASVMLLDEPTSNLDLAHQAQVMDLVAALVRRRGAAALVAMHDLSLAAQYCDRLVMIAGGRVFAEGRPRDVLTAEKIASVYQTAVVVLSHPETGAPVVMPASGAPDSTTPPNTEAGLQPSLSEPSDRR